METDILQPSKQLDEMRHMIAGLITEKPTAAQSMMLKCARVSINCKEDSHHVGWCYLFTTTQYSR